MVDRHHPKRCRASPRTPPLHPTNPQFSLKLLPVVLIGLVVSDYAVNLDFSRKLDAIWLAPVGSRGVRVHDGDALGGGGGGGGGRPAGGRRRGGGRDAILKAEGGSERGGGGLIEAVEGSFEEEDEEEEEEEEWGGQSTNSWGRPTLLEYLSALQYRGWRTSVLLQRRAAFHANSLVGSQMGVVLALLLVFAVQVTNGRRHRPY